MKDTNERIRNQIRQFENASPDKQVPVNPLGMVLTGTIDAAVNGGVKNYKVSVQNLSKNDMIIIAHVRWLTVLFHVF